MKLPTRETKAHLEAFEIYYKMGADRSYQKVGKKYGKSRPWVEAVAKAFNWKAKVDERDRKAMEDSLDDYDARLKKAHRENFEIIDKVKKIVKKRVSAILKKMDEKGTVRDISLGDFEKIAKLELLMLGDPTERVSDETITGLVKRASESIRNRNRNKGN